MTREKIIHSAKADYINPHFFILDLVTSSGDTITYAFKYTIQTSQLDVFSSGTYIKEFVHGDRGRTHPSAGSLLGCDADILQLDVMHLYV